MKDKTPVRCLGCKWEGTFEQLDHMRFRGEPLCPSCSCEEIEEMEGVA